MRFFLIVFALLDPRPKTIADVEARADSARRLLGEAEERYVKQQIENLKPDEAGLWKIVLVYRNPNSKAVVIGGAGGQGVVASTGSPIIKDTGAVFVFRVIDGNSALIGLGPANESREYVLEGFTTKDFKEGKWCKCDPGPVATMGETSYKPLAGAVKTVPLLRVAKTAAAEAVIRDIKFVRTAKNFETIGDARYLQIVGKMSRFELPDGTIKEIETAKLTDADKKVISDFVRDERKRSQALNKEKR